jgi:hypothetical protein
MIMMIVIIIIIIIIIIIVHFTQHDKFQKYFIRTSLYIISVYQDLFYGMSRRIF